MKTVISTSMAILFLLASGQAFAVGGGDCCVPNGTPGCDTPGCQASICSTDVFCCEIEWDQACANQAAAICAVCGGSSDCCKPVGIPGCGVPSCQDCVCVIDPFCCDVLWDNACAGAAAGVCQDHCPCQTSFCGDGTCDPNEDSCNCVNDCPGPCCGDRVCDSPGDTCETCPLDCGACPDRPCPTDLNGDGTTNAADLAILLGAWGSCE